MDIIPTESYNIDCYVDTDFVAPWGLETDQDPLYIKSRTRLLIMCIFCLLL